MTDTHAYTAEQFASQPATARVEEPPIFPIVGLVGASGSRQALETFFRHLPSDSGMAFVVVTRLAAKQHSQLAAAIEARTDMPVLSAADGAAIQLDHIYIAPLGTQLTLAKGVLRLHNPTREGEQGLLDTFLSSLAVDQQENAVAILLSGTGEDGIAGIQAVKTQGGIVLVQEPDNAAHPALPRRGVATGVADHVNAAAEIAQYLIQIRGDLANTPLPTQPAIDESFTQLFTAVLGQIVTQTGHDLSHYKASTLQRRIARRMQMAGIQDLARYLALLQTNPEETRSLFRDSLVSVTNFFRDPDAYEMLERDCIPQLFLNKGRTDFVRIWVAGCATGEEAYSIAMQLSERALQVQEPPRFQIFATDLDEEAIAVARRGLYPATIAKDIAPTRLQRYFVEENGAYRVKPDLREQVLFAVHNLLKDPPFSRVDLICCRNVLIYFTREAQERLFNLFHYSLNPSGYLFLGTSESADTASDLFAVLNKYCHLYQRRDVISGPQQRLPTATPITFGAKSSERMTQPQSPKARTVEEMYTAWTLRMHTPPRLLVNEHYDITYLFGGADRYLQEREGAITQNVLHKVLPDLRLDLRAALYQAFNKRERTISRLMRVELEGRAQMVQLHVGPVTEPGFPHEYVEVVFVVQENAALLGLPPIDEAVEIDLSLVARMEEELLRTRERLQTIIEEYEVSGQELKASNEELQSINEELKSTTEELETSKEELQSMNEELITVNHELKFKIDELSRVNSDLLNLIASTDVGVIFLDQRLFVKRFTPRATELFHLIETDLGRPFAHIAHRIRLSILSVRPLEYAARVLETLEQVEVIIQSEDERWYMLRFFPYRTIDQVVDGVVITFIDISDLKRAESEVQQRIQQQAVAELGRQALRSDDLPDLLSSATARVAQILEIELCSIFVLETEDATERLRLQTGVGWPTELMGQVVIEKNSDYPSWAALAQDEPIWVEDVHQQERLRFSPIFSQQGVVSGVSVAIGGSEQPYGVLSAYSKRPSAFTVHEVSFVQSIANLLGEALARQQAEAQLRASEERLRLGVSVAGLAIAEVDYTTDTIQLTAEAAALFGLPSTPTVVARQNVHALFHPDGRDELLRRIAQALDPGNGGELIVEHRIIRLDGAVRWLSVRKQIFFVPDANGVKVPVRSLLAALDITERKLAEEQLRASEEFNRILLESSPDCVKVLDAEGQLLRMNGPGLYLMEIDDFSPLVGQAWATLWPPEAGTLIHTALASARHGEQGRFECFCPTAKGTLKWWDVIVAPVQDGQGTTTHFIAASRDITEAKAAEAALRVSEAKLNTILDNTPAAIYMLSPDHRYLFVNRYFAEGYHLAEGEILGLSVFDRFAPEVASVLAANERRVLESRSALTIEEAAPRDGAMRYYSTVKAPVLDEAGEPYAIIGISLDITERIHAEKALRASEERYRTLFETMDEGFCIMEMIFDEANQPIDYRFIEINPAFERMTGLENALGKTARQLLPTLENHWFEIYGSVALTGEARHFTEGSAAMGRWFDVYAFRHGEPESRRVALLFNDITERKRVEDEVQRSRNLLQRMAEASPDDISIYDLRQEQIIFSNRKPGLTNFSGETIWATTPAEINSPIHPDDVEQVQKEFARIHTAADGQVVETVFRQRQPDGDYCWHQERTVVFARDDQGQVIQYLSISTNIDDRMRVESNQKFLSELSVALSLSSDPTQIQQTVVQRLGEYLGTSRCRFSAIDLAADKTTLLASWRQTGEPPPLTVIPLSSVVSPAYIADAQAGRTLVVSDVSADSRPITPHQLLRESGLAAQISVPCLRNGQWVASLHILQSTPRQWQADEVQLVESVVHHFWPLVEKSRAEAALRQQEELLRQIADNVPGLIGYVGADERYRFVNATFERWFQCPRQQIVGSTVRELIGDEEHGRLTIYRQKALMGETVSYETSFTYPDGITRSVWGRYQPHFAADGTVQGFYLFLMDISERKQAEADLRFLAELAERIRLAEDAETLLAEATDQVGKHLGVGRAFFAEHNSAQDQGVIHHQYSPTLPPVATEFLLSSYPSATMDELAAGHTLVNHDAQRDPRTAALYATIYAPEQKSAYMGVPLLQQGNLVATLSVTSPQARQWQAHEIGILETVAERVWLAVERLRLDASLRQSEERLRLGIDLAELVIAEVDYRDDTVHLTPETAALYGLPSDVLVVPRTAVHALFHPDEYLDMMQRIETALDPTGDGWLAVEHRIVRPDGAVRWLNVRQRTFFSGEGKHARPQRALLVARDITERKQAEAALRASEARYRQLADAMPQIVFTARSDGMIDYVNAQWQQSTGLSEQQLIREGWQLALHPNDIERSATAWTVAVASRQPYEIENRLRITTGEYCWQLARAVPIHNEAGEIVQWIGTSIDIDDRKRREQHQQFLSALGMQLRLLSDTDTMMAQLVTSLGQYLEVAACRINEVDLTHQQFTVQKDWVGVGEAATGVYPLAELAPPAILAELAAGHTVAVANTTTDPRTAPVVEAYYTEQVLAFIGVPMFRGEQWSATLSIKGEGERLWQQDEIRLLEAIAGQFWPLLERVRAEEALRLSELRFRSTFENAAVGIAEIGLDGRWLRVNERLTEIVGYTPAELQATTFQAITHPDDLAADLANMERVLAGEAESHHLEKRYFHKEGHLVWIYLSVALLRDQAGAPQYFIAVIEDINERKQQEQALQELNATLDQRVRDRTAELERSNRELDRFAYVASHDLKSPLRGIDTLAGWISEDADAVLPEASKGHLSKLRGRIKRLENLLDDLLAYSRAGRYQYSPESVATGPLIQDIIELLDPPASLVVTVAETMPKLLATRTPLETVLRNLINNAIKHHDRADGHVHIVAEEYADHIEFCVIDDGPGIHPQYHERIFELFQTLKPRDQVEGSGMGLAIVKKTVENYGGRITVESAEGEGATFRFTWPKWKE